MWQLPPLKSDQILIYLRKSRTDDPLLSVEEVLSKHEQMLNEWVERNLKDIGPIPEENRFREIVSGETIESRPEVQKVLRGMESPYIKAVLIVEPQRLSRGDLEDIGRLTKILRYTNTIVITLQYIYDLNDERDRDAFERELKRGNEFLEYQKRIMRNGRLLSVENGNYIGNTAPYGYRKIQVKDGKRKFHTLEPVPEEARAVKLMFEMYAKGIGTYTIARTLDDMGFPAPRGEIWCAENLGRYLTNEHYLGMVRWNHRKTTKTVEDGEIVTSRPVYKDYLLFPGKHEAIIEQNLWDAVQEMRKRIPPVKARAKCACPLAGLIYCQCGHPLTRRTYNRKDGTQKSAPRMICNNQIPCGTASCTEEEMIGEVEKILVKAIADFELKIKQSKSNTVILHREMIERLEHRVEELEKQELSQWEKYTQEGMPKHIFDQLNAKVLKEKEENLRALQKAKSTLPAPIDYQQKLLNFHDALDALRSETVPALEKNLLLKKCIERINYRRKKKETNNHRYGEPEQIELETVLKV